MNILDQVPVHVIPCVEGRTRQRRQLRRRPASTARSSPRCGASCSPLRSRGLGSVWTTLHLAQGGGGRRAARHPRGHDPGRADPGRLHDRRRLQGLRSLKSCEFKDGIPSILRSFSARLRFTSTPVVNRVTMRSLEIWWPLKRSSSSLTICDCSPKHSARTKKSAGSKYHSASSEIFSRVRGGTCQPRNFIEFVPREPAAANATPSYCHELR